MHARGVAPQPPPHQLSLDDPLVAEALTRNVQFFGHTGQARVCGAFVVVVGLGGVGSHAASMLLRSGVGRLRVIDFDQVTLSSLNRSAVAERSDVGLPKATCAAPPRLVRTRCSLTYPRRLGVFQGAEEPL